MFFFTLEKILCNEQVYQFSNDAADICMLRLVCISNYSINLMLRTFLRCKCVLCLNAHFIFAIQFSSFNIILHGIKKKGQRKKKCSLEKPTCLWTNVWKFDLDCFLYALLQNRWSLCVFQFICSIIDIQCLKNLLHIHFRMCAVCFFLSFLSFLCSFFFPQWILLSAFFYTTLGFQCTCTHQRMTIISYKTFIN